MKVKIVFLGKEKEVNVKNNSNVLDLLKKIKVNSESVIIKRGREIIPDTEKLKNNDKIEILRVVSGG